jgi:hypothetical protein
MTMNEKKRPGCCVEGNRRIQWMPAGLGGSEVDGWGLVIDVSGSETTGFLSISFCPFCGATLYGQKVLEETVLRTSREVLSHTLTPSLLPRVVRTTRLPDFQTGANPIYFGEPEESPYEDFSLED